MADEERWRFIPPHRWLTLSLGIICALCWLPSAEAKTQKGVVILGHYSDDKTKEHSWKYVSKFGYHIGDGKYDVRLRAVRQMNQDADLTLDVYLDEEWDEVEAMLPCNRTAKARTMRTISVPADGNWSSWASGTLIQRVRPHVWYFALHDCNTPLTSMTRFRFEFRAKQEDDSEFSVELSGMSTLVTVKLIGMAIFMVHFFKLCRKFQKTAEELHPIVIVLAVAIVLHVLATVFQWFHLYSYSFDGTGLKALDVLCEICGMLSQILLTSLMILLALGYTLLSSDLGELDIVIPVVMMIAIIHCLLVGFSKIRDDAAFKFHENEGAFGVIICVFRCLLFAWFVCALRGTYNAAGYKLKPFLMKFGFASSSYFLAYPVIFCFTAIWAPYYRHRVMVIGLFVMQSGCILWLTRLFLTRGDYFQVSTLSSTFLPSAISSVYSKDS